MRTKKINLNELRTLVNQIIKENLSVTDLSKQIFSLVKYNNGYFKSEKQAKYLISYLEKYEGFLGGGEVYGNTYTFMAKWDEKGITEINKILKNNKTLLNFKRRNDSEEIKHQEILKDIKQKQNDMTNKHYLDMINVYEERINFLKNSINDLNLELKNPNNPLSIKEIVSDSIKKYEKEIEEKMEEINDFKSRINH